MRIVIRRLMLIFVSGVVLTSWPRVVSLAADEPKTEDKAPTDDEIKALIAQLKSPHRPPVLRGDLPPGDLYREQRRAFSKLLDAGAGAIPHVIKHLDDKSFSFPAEVNGGVDNVTVGQACKFVIEHYYEPLDRYADGNSGGPREAQSRPSYVRQLLIKHDSYEGLWKATKDTPRRQLQLDALRYTLKAEESSKKYPAEELQYVRSKLAELEKSDKPLSGRWPFAK